MLRSLSVVILFVSGTFLYGCASGNGNPPGTSPAVPNLEGNWQIQSNTSPGVPTVGLRLRGDLHGSGADVSGTFRFSNLTAPLTCGLNEVVAVTGVIDKKNELTLTSAALPDGTVVKVQLSVPSDPTSFSTGTIAATGGTCTFASATAFGAQFTPASGSYAGPVTPNALYSPTPGALGTATLKLAQASAPAAGGEFLVNGTFFYVFGGCTGQIAVSGYANGVLLQLSSDPTVLDPAVAAGGTLSPTATQIIVRNLTINPSSLCPTNPPPDTAYTGTLLQQ